MPRTHVPTRHIISVSFELFIRGYEVLKTGDTRLELWMLELGNTYRYLCVMDTTTQERNASYSEN